MKAILLLLLSMTTSVCFGQIISPTLGFNSDFQANRVWYPEFGARIGIGAHNIQFDSLPFNYSLNFNAQISASRRNTHLDQVLFDVQDSDDQQIGFARAEFQKTAFSIDYDFGYIYQVGHVDATQTYISPYLSIGPRIENYRARAHYELYGTDSCYCTNPTKVPINSIWSLGANVQTGVKFMFYSVGVDFRAGYYMGWSLGNKGTNYLPVAESFNIDAYGTPQFEHRSNNFNRGFNFSVNLIIKIQSNHSGFYYSDGSSSGWNTSDDDESDDANYEEEESSGSGGSGCGGSLSPAGRGGG